MTRTTLRNLFVCLTIATSVACSGDDNAKVGANNDNNENNPTNNEMDAGTDPTDTGSVSNGTEDTGGIPDLGDVEDLTIAEDLGAPDMTVDAGPPPDPVSGAGQATLVMDGFQFTEGPRWFSADGVLRFTDIPASTIYELSPPNDISVFRNPSAQANGLAFDPTGRLLAAEHQGRRISVTTANGPEVLVDSYQGMAFNSPNDLALHSGGWIYFTDPPYGLGNRTREVPFNGLYRFAPSDDTLVAEWEGATSTRPNGVVLSPDESVLYLADTAASKVYTFDVAADGALSNRQEWVDSPSPDGMAVDSFGNVYVAAQRGVDVFAPDGTLWGTIGVPQQPANVAFGGPQARQLFVTARTGLYRIQMTVTGFY